MHYISAGSGDAVVLIHGAANDWHEWAINIEGLSRDFKIFAPDLPGFGQSEPFDKGLASSWLIPFLKEFIDNLGLKRTHIVGHSLGGLITMEFALKYPDTVNKLVLVDSAGLGDISFTGKIILKLVRAIKRIIGTEISTNFSNDTSERWILLEHLKDIKCPVLIVWGQNDLYLPTSHAKKACELLPNAILKIFPFCHHAPHREKKEEFEKLIRDFLKAS